MSRITSLHRTLATTSVLAAVLLAWPLTADDVEPGIDVWFTPEGTTTTGPIGLPGDFFDPGSNSLNVDISLVGYPLPDLGEVSLQGADTVIERLQTAVLSECGASDTIAIRIMALSLVSVDPITVTYGGGRASELWDVQVCLSDTSQRDGWMEIQADCEAGGDYSSDLHVRPKFVFTRRTDSAVRVLDDGASGELTLSVNGADWVHDPEPGLATRVEAGAVTNGDCDDSDDPLTELTELTGSSNFAAGILATPCSCSPSQAKASVSQEIRTVDEEALWARHEVEPATPGEVAYAPGRRLSLPHEETGSPEGERMRPVQAGGLAFLVFAFAGTVAFGGRRGAKAGK